MGLLSTGTSLTWEEIEQWAEFVKEHGIIQFINIYNGLKDRKNDLLKYGDEIEYTLVRIDHQNKKVQVDLRASEILEILQEAESNHEICLNSLWRMEYASYMIEGTPGKPFCCTVNRLKLIETSMWLRKFELDEVLSEFDPNLTSICYSAFPRVGCENFTHPAIDLSQTDNPISRSAYFPDDAVFQDHPRFGNLTRNIRSRLGCKQKIYVPVWFDTNTPRPFMESIPIHADIETRQSIIPDHIYMDCMGFGMGCSCLQITIQAGDVDEARYIYDQLGSFAPILMALSACSPAWKGILSDWDCRWKIISMACDDRKPDERLSNCESSIRKSRYDTIDMYLHQYNQPFNDVCINYSQKHFQALLNAGVDEILARHIAHLFCRDPISMFHEKLMIDDTVDIDHFENLQSTNWQSCRFKPPPPGTTIGWRVEFRTLEVQFTCFENAMFVIFVVLLSRTLLINQFNFVVPISKMEENLDRAVISDAVHRSKFYIRKNYKNTEVSQHDTIVEMTLDEIFNGKSNKFIGLIGLVEEYVSQLELDTDSLDCVKKCLGFIRDRANGKIMTPATWIRNFIQSHPKYQQDSLVSDEIQYDMTCRIKEITDGKIACPDLLGSHRVQKPTVAYIEAYKKMIKIESMSNTETKLGLLSKSARRKGPLIKLNKRWQIFESLFKHHLQYTNYFMLHSTLGEIFQ